MTEFEAATIAFQQASLEIGRAGLMGWAGAGRGRFVGWGRTMWLDLRRTPLYAPFRRPSRPAASGNHAGLGSPN